MSLFILKRSGPSAATATGASMFFSHDFEDNTWGGLGHGPTGGDSDGTSIQTTIARDTYAALVDYRDGKNLNHIWYDGLRAQGANTEFYCSFWFYHATNFRFDSNHKFMRLTGAGGLTSCINHEFYGHGYESGTGVNAIFREQTANFHNQPLSNCPCGGTLYNPDNQSTDAGAVVRGQWHHWESYMQMNTQGNDDGTIVIWIDDNVVTNEQGTITFVGGSCDPTSTDHSWDRIVMPSNLADNCLGDPTTSDCLYYLDDIEIWDGLPSDVTLP